MDSLHKYPRLYSDFSFSSLGDEVVFDVDQAHYLRHVLRKDVGDYVRVFNGRDGEFLAVLRVVNKKQVVAVLERMLKDQPVLERRVHLLFAPIKKNRLDFLLEKAVELGVTDLHPVVTAHTEVRGFKEARVWAHIVEASEQCERLILPVLHDMQPLQDKIFQWSEDFPVVLWCSERSSSPSLFSMDLDGDVSFLIGPEGGFDSAESAFLSGSGFVTPISLGDMIYRAETAALLCLSRARS